MRSSHPAMKTANQRHRGIQQYLPPFRETKAATNATIERGGYVLVRETETIQRRKIQTDKDLQQYWQSNKETESTSGTDNQPDRRKYPDMQTTNPPTRVKQFTPLVIKSTALPSTISSAMC
jgi:hypothetical protein